MGAKQIISSFQTLRKREITEYIFRTWTQRQSCGRDCIKPRHYPRSKITSWGWKHYTAFDPKQMISPRYGIWELNTTLASLRTACTTSRMFSRRLLVGLPAKEPLICTAFHTLANIETPMEPSYISNIFSPSRSWIYWFSLLDRSVSLHHYCCC